MVEIRILHNGTYKKLEVGRKELIRFTYQRYDITDIQAFLSSFSQTIELEGNSNNISVLENITSLDIYKNINNLNNEIFINKRFNCVYIINDYQFDGLLTITSVRRVNGTGEIVIECDIRSLEVNITELLGNAQLRSNNGNIGDLNMDDLIHTLDIPTIVNTWENYEDQGYYYPIINYSNIASNEMLIRDFRPAIKAKYLVDKIFDSIGLQYTSTFLNSDEFKDIIHPWTDTTFVNDEDLEERLFKVGLTDDTTPIYAGGFTLTKYETLKFNDETSQDFFDNNNNFDTSTHKYTVQKRGLYSFNLSGEFSPILRVFNGQQLYGLTNSEPNKLTFELIRERNGEVKIMETYYQNFLFDFNTFVPTTLIGGSIWERNMYPVTFNFSSSEEELFVDDVLYIRYRFIFNTRINNLAGQQVTSSFAIKFNRENDNGTFTTFSNNANKAEALYLNEPINPKNGIPDNIKQVDYLKSILKHFNMVIKYDKFNLDTYIIEPYDDLIAVGNIKDFTHKLDNDEEISISRMEQYLDKNILLKYQTDNAYYNRDYLELYKLNYGSYRIDNLETTTNDDYVIDSIFNGTASYYVPNTSVPIPQIYDIDNNGKLKQNVFGMRILYRVSIDTSSQDYKDYARVENFNMRFLDDDGSETLFLSNTLTTSPGVDNPAIVNTAHHFSNPIKSSESNDLNFGYQNIYYHHLDTTLPTDNNIYNRFWKNTIDIINNPNATYIICRMFLNSSDIFNLDLDDRIVINENMYVINRILNWYDGETCEVELIKLI
jgi:hypothetical protein